MLSVNDQFAWQVAFAVGEIILRQESRQDGPALFLNRYLGEKILTAQYSSAAHADQMHAGSAWIDDGSDHIDITRATFHALLILHAAQNCYLIPQFCCPLEVKLHCCLLHCRR